MVLFGLYGKSFQIRPNPPLSIHVLFSLPGMCLFYGQAPPYLSSLLCVMVVSLTIMASVTPYELPA